MLGRNLRTTQLISIIRRMPRTQSLNKLNLAAMREQFDPRLEGVLDTVHLGSKCSGTSYDGRTRTFPEGVLLMPYRNLPSASKCLNSSADRETDR